MKEMEITLIQACIKLLKSKTIDDISVTQICDEAKVSRITFYRYFQDKYDLSNSILPYLEEPVIEEYARTRDYSKYFKDSCRMIHDNYHILRRIYINSDDQNSFQSYLIESNIKGFEQHLNLNKLTEEQRFQIYAYVYGCTHVNWKVIKGEIDMDYEAVLDYCLNIMPPFLKPILQID